LKDISLKVDAGQSLAIVGPSGSGKSTLLNMIGALDVPDSGKVIVNGKNIAEFDEKALAQVRNVEVGFVFQLHHLLGQCTVLENVLVPTLAGATGGQRKEIEERAEQLLDRVGLSDWAMHLPGELSGGQRQRVAVARALINEPALLLADEPTGSLDRESAEQMAQLLVELNESQGTTLIVVTHSQELASRMSRVMTLADGILMDN
jgi:ABC-type lipoprotein export system ATPase subunit